MDPTSTQSQTDPQLQAIMQKYNYTPQGQAPTPNNDWNDFKNGTGSYAPPPAQVSPGDQFNQDIMKSPVVKTAVDTGTGYAKTIADQVPNFAGGKGGEVFDQLNRGNLEPTNDTNVNPIIRASENALGGTMQVVNTIFAPFGAALKAVSDNIGEAAAKNPAIINNPVVGKITDFVQGNANAISKMAQDHPEAARNLGNIFGIVLTALSGEEGGKMGLFEGKGLDTSILPGTFGNPQPLLDAAKSKVIGGDVIPATPDTPVEERYLPYDRIQSRLHDITDLTLAKNNPEIADKIMSSVSADDKVGSISALTDKINESLTPEEQKIAAPDISRTINDMSHNEQMLKTEMPGGEDMSHKMYVTDNKGIVGNIKDAAQATKEVATSTGEEVVGGAKNIATKARQLIAGKTPEEVLATTPENVAKLRPDQQQYWRDENINTPAGEKLKSIEEGKQQDISNIQAESGSKKAVIKQQGDIDATKLEKQLNDAKTGVSKASVDDVNNMKEQARTIIGQKSDEFATLRNKEMTGFRRVATTNQEISDFIDKNVPNRADAQTVKETLGITDDNLKAKTNLSKVEQLSREIRDKVGRGVATGNQPAGTSDFFYSKSAGLLDDFMGTKGVDLSGSKSMWKNWTPTRDTLVKDFNVYDYKNIEPAPASKMIQKRIQGLDTQYNAKLEDVEKTLDQPLDTETKTAYQKLTDAQQAKMNQEIKTAADMETARSKAAFDKAETLRTAKEQKGEITAQQSEQLRKINIDNMTRNNKLARLKIASYVIGGGLSAAEVFRILTTGRP